MHWICPRVGGVSGRSETVRPFRTDTKKGPDFSGPEIGLTKTNGTGHLLEG